MSETQSRLHANLSKSEIGIIRAILAGHTSAQDLAEALGVNTRTIQSHLNNIYKKTGAYNKTDLLLMALGRKSGAIDVAGQLNRWSKRASI